MHLLWTLIIGLVVGAVAKLLMPGRDPHRGQPTWRYVHERGGGLRRGTKIRCMLRSRGKREASGGSNCQGIPARGNPGPVRKWMFESDQDSTKAIRLPCREMDG
jgi:hypothetical protein